MKDFVLGVDELLATFALVVGILFGVSWLVGLATLYLFMCIAFRKYEAILKRQKGK
jgi:hypothetical protein